MCECNPYKGIWIGYHDLDFGCDNVTGSSSCLYVKPLICMVNLPHGNIIWGIGGSDSNVISYTMLKFESLNFDTSVCLYLRFFIMFMLP